MNRKRIHYSDRKPIQTNSIFWGCVGLLTIMAEVAILFYDAFLEGELPNFIAGSGVLFAALALVALLRSIKYSKDENFNNKSRSFGVFATGLSLFLWVALYCVGIFVS